MNYTAIYNQLINRALLKSHIDVFETHHIIPRSMGGTDDFRNLVKLTLKEHYIAHHLLWKIHNNKQMTHAFWAMSQMTKNGRITCRTYEKLRVQRIEFLKIENTGKKHSEETKKKIGEKSKGRKHTDKTKKIQSEANAGKVLSEETKQKIRDANLGREDDGRYVKIAESNKGKRHSEETKKKMSCSSRHTKMSIEHKEKLNKIHTGRIVTEETKQKIRDANLGKKASEEARENMRLAALNRKKRFDK